MSYQSNLFAAESVIAPTGSELAGSIPSGVLSCGIFLIILQIVDGALTACGISYFGVHSEGNPLLKYLMLSIGHINALVVCKSLAIIAIIVLVTLARQVSWLKRSLQIVIAIYLATAIVPWSALLITYSLM